MADLPTPKLTREQYEGQQEGGGKAPKQPDAPPPLNSQTVYSDRELEAGDYSEQEIADHEAQLIAARKQGLDIHYTASALDEVKELNALFFERTNIDVTAPDISQVIWRTLGKEDKKLGLKLRNNYKEGLKSATLDRVDAFIKAGGPNPRLAYARSELAQFSPEILQKYDSLRGLLQDRNIISALHFEATPAYLAEQAMEMQQPAPVMQQPTQIVTLTPAPAAQPVSPVSSIEPIAPVAPARRAQPSQIVPQSPAEVLAAVSRPRPPSMSATATELVNPETMQATPTPPARPSSMPMTRLERRSTSSIVSDLTGGAPPRLGDKQVVVANYKDLSLCHQVTLDALNRAEMAMQILDEKHANAIRALINRAMVKNRNAKGAGTKPISFKRATSIAIRAERWVYQAQAAAAKHMVKESKKCLHNMAGRAKRSTQDKIDTYAKRAASGQSGYLGPRGVGSTELALKRLQRKNTRLLESAASQAELAPIRERRKTAAKLARAQSRAASAQPRQ